ncbi:MAG: class I SAM-dependent methyltransferase [Alphaproteobacteria bacterium]|nr:class I SAM-dependent methyltransferase [Alphaproteobacteria bacterium]
MSVVGKLHAGLVFGRRVRVLARHLAAQLPPNARVLDVGCGDGRIDAAIGQQRPDVQIEGVDVLIRPSTHIPVTKFDGAHLPFPDASFDIVQFVDVLHHTDDPMILLREARRVARTGIVLKDHGKDGFLAGPTLRFMDWVGNAHHGVVLPYNYWPIAKWRAAFAELGLKPATWLDHPGLYPWPASLAFERKLHFITRLERAS